MEVCWRVTSARREPKGRTSNLTSQAQGNHRRLSDSGLIVPAGPRRHLVSLRRPRQLVVLERLRWRDILAFRDPQGQSTQRSSPSSTFPSYPDPSTYTRLVPHRGSSGRQEGLAPLSTIGASPCDISNSASTVLGQQFPGEYLAGRNRTYRIVSHP